MEKLRAYLEGKDPETGKARRQSALAEAVGMSKPYLSQILAGARRPSYDMMCKIRDATGGEVPLEAWE